MILDVEFENAQFLVQKSCSLYSSSFVFFINPSWRFIINTAMIFCLQTVETHVVPVVQVMKMCGVVVWNFPKYSRRAPWGCQPSNWGASLIPNSPVANFDRGVDLDLSHKSVAKNNKTVMRFSIYINQKYSAYLYIMISLYKYEFFHVICPAAHLFLDTVLRYAFLVDEGSLNRRGEIADIIPLGGGNSNMFYFLPDPWGRWTQFD